LLAREIARRWNVPVHSAVKRIRATPPQAGLTNAERRANVRSAGRSFQSGVLESRARACF
jgi:predicted amidophosphoribosyltransferase